MYEIKLDMPNYTAVTLNRVLKKSLAQYPLINNECNTVKDVVGHYVGSITNGEWQVRF